MCFAPVLPRTILSVVEILGPFSSYPLSDALGANRSLPRVSTGSLSDESLAIAFRSSRIRMSIAFRLHRRTVDLVVVVIVGRGVPV